MKIRNDKGFTGVDIAISTVILITFVTLITTMFYNLAVTAKKIERKTIATNLAIQTIEAMKIIEFDELTETMTINEIKNLIESKISIPNGYDIEVVVDNTKYSDVIKIISAQVNYKNGKITENVKIETLVKNYNIVPIVITASLRIEETGEKTVKLILNAENQRRKYTYKTYINGEIVQTGTTSASEVEMEEYETFFDVGIQDAYAIIEYEGGTVETNHETKEDLKIKYKEELESFRDKVNSGKTYEGKTITQIADIDLQKKSWTAIGTSTNTFKGTYEGRNHQIYNLYINTTQECQGLFEYNYGTIQNLILSNIDLKSSAAVFGAICGRNYGNIENVIIESGTIIGSKSYVGGIAGSLKEGTIKNCINKSNITSNTSSEVLGSCVGGIVGYSLNGNIVENCANIGNITGTGKLVGGIVGYNTGEGSTIKQCYNTGTITGDLQQVGGIVGDSDWNSIVDSCYNAGTIKSNNSQTTIYTGVGGIVGCLVAGAQMNNCYNIGTIIFDATLVTDNINQNKTYEALIGYRNRVVTQSNGFPATTVSNNYYLESSCDHGMIEANTSQGDISIVTTGSKTSAELKVLASILGTAYKTDINNINRGYPILNW